MVKPLLKLAGILFIALLLFGAADVALTSHAGTSVAFVSAEDPPVGGGGGGNGGLCPDGHTGCRN